MSPQQQSLTGRVCAAIVTLALFTSLVGCAWILPNAATQRADAGALSKQVAESTYQAIYRASKSGQVGARDLAEARLHYDRWARAQDHYVSAAHAGREDIGSVVTITAAIHALITIAQRNEVL
mgnify:FL=1